MSLSATIHKQFKGFAKAGKTICPPKNYSEKIISKFIAVFLIIITFSAVVNLIQLRFLPLRIYLRAFIYLIPLIALIIRFLRGISISWLIAGLSKWWLLPVMFMITFLLLAYFFYHIISGNEFNLPKLYQTSGLYIILLATVMITYMKEEIKFIIKNSERKEYKNLSLEEKWKCFACGIGIAVFLPFLLGGFYMLIAGLGIVPIGA